MSTATYAVLGGIMRRIRAAVAHRLIARSRPLRRVERDHATVLAVRGAFGG